MVPPDFNRTGRMNLSFARNFAITTPTTATGPSAFFIRLQAVSSVGGLVLLGPFGLNVYVLHFRNVHGVYVKRQFSSGSAVPLTKSAVESFSETRWLFSASPRPLGKTAATRSISCFLSTW